MTYTGKKLSRRVVVLRIGRDRSTCLHSGLTPLNDDKVEGGCVLIGKLLLIRKGTR